MNVISTTDSAIEFCGVFDNHSAVIATVFLISEQEKRERKNISNIVAFCVMSIQRTLHEKSLLTYPALLYEVEFSK